MAEIRKRLVIYTVLTGSKEPLGNPLAELPGAGDSDLEIGFVCFTDNRQLKSEVWEFRYLDDIPLPAEKLSRRPKALPHEYLQDWEYSLYVDNIVVFKRLPQHSDLQQSHAGPVFKAFKHATRSNPQQEAEAIVQLGYESVARISNQLNFYAGLLPLSDITPLSTCTVILREHMHPSLVKFGVTWWEQILNFCKRDQMSFDFSIKWSGAQIEYLPGLKHDNDLIQNTANIQPNRVHANFDAVKYGWLNRDQPAALANPRQHYLEHGRHKGQDYSSKSELLDYLCYRHGSSLGSEVAPRRKLSSGLQNLLQHRRARGNIDASKILFVHVKDAGPTAFGPAEYELAEMVLCSYLPGYGGTRVALDSAQLAQGQLGWRAQDGQYALVFVLGLPGPFLNAAYRMLKAALHPVAGAMVVVATQSCSVADIAQIEADITQSHAVPCSSKVGSSEHDSLDAAIFNSLLAFEWGA